MRRRLLALALVLVTWTATTVPVPTRAFFAITQIGCVKANGANTFTTGNLDTTGASLLTMTFADDTGPDATPSDNQTHTWNIARSYEPFGLSSRIYYAWGTITTSSTHTFTLTGTGISASLQACAWSGVQTASDPLDQSNEDLSFGSATVQPGSVTPSTNGQLIITHFEGDTFAGGDPTINSSFTGVVGDPGSGGTYVGSYMAYLVQSTAAAVNPTWTRASGTNNNYATIATFKEAAAGGGSGPCKLALLGVGCLLEPPRAQR